MPSNNPEKEPKKIGIIIALLSVYLIWGSTYLAIRIGLESIPPFLLIGSRFLAAGVIATLYLFIRRTPLPNRIQMKNSAIVGLLMLSGGVGGTAFAEQWVASGIAAIGIATVPLWAAILAGLFGQWPTRTEWAGITFGFLGVAILSLDKNLHTNPIGAAALLVAAACWAFGSILSQRISLPSGPMGFAIELLTGGSVLVLAGILRGERISAIPTSQAIIAWLYLVSFGSLIGFSAFMYLIKRVRLSLATSYAYVNPMIAVLLGFALAEEQISAFALIGMIVILASVGIIAIGQKRK